LEPFSEKQFVFHFSPFAAQNQTSISAIRMQESGLALHRSESDKGAFNFICFFLIFGFLSVLPRKLQAFF
jgi:hypothetical protein